MSQRFSNRRFRDLFLEYQHIFVLLVPPVFMTLLVVTQGWNGGTSFWLQYWWMFIVALIGATVANTVGISGSALFVPFFIFIFPLLAAPLAPETLVKVGLITESFGLSSSALAFARYGLIDYKMGIAVVLGALPFVVSGAILSFLISAWVFYTLLGVLLLVSAVLVRRHDGHSISDGHASEGDNRIEADGRDDDGENVSKDDLDGNTYAYSRSGYLERFGYYGAGGSFQGLAGFGIGEIGIIAMLRSNVPVRIAIGTNHIVVALTAIVASITHVTQSAHLSAAPTPWNIIFMTVPGVVIGGQLAPYVAARLPADRLQQGIAVLFTVLAIALFGLAAF